jgi:hypothetical protein
MLNEVDSFRAGRIDLASLTSNLKGLLGASDLHGTELVRAFWNHFAPIDMELELRNEKWGPKKELSDERLDEDLSSFREWVKEVLQSSNQERE